MGLNSEAVRWIKQNTANVLEEGFNNLTLVLPYRLTNLYLRGLATGEQWQRDKSNGEHCD